MASFSTPFFLHVYACAQITHCYLPAQGPTEEYKDPLSELEDTLSKYLSSPTILLGDFNAHLGQLGGPRGSGPVNTQGLMLKDLIDRHELCVLSLQSQASGPTHTYCSGPHSTTVDYIICNQSAYFICSSASTLDDHALNTSDHITLESGG